MSDAFDPTVSMIKEEMDAEPWGVLQEVDEECDMTQQGAALLPVKHEMDIEEHDLEQRGVELTAVKIEIEIDIEQHPEAPNSGNKESPTASQLTPTAEAYSIKLEEESNTTVHKQSGAKKGPRGTLKKKRTGEKPFKCDQCIYSFTQSNHLKIHLRTHTGEKPFKCDHCNFSFSRSGILTNHLRTHTGEKPYECDQCDFSSSSSGSLTNHIRTHTGEKPYNCDQCELSFRQRSNLTSHLRTHTGEKPYKCDQCEFRCNQKYNLKRHLRKHSEKAIPI